MPCALKGTGVQQPVPRFVRGVFAQLLEKLGMIHAELGPATPALWVVSVVGGSYSEFSIIKKCNTPSHEVSRSGALVIL